MRKVQCHECGKRYDYDTDDFCPKCGAFTQPLRESRIDANGYVVRVEGINEINHRGSFLHAELHEENKKRRGTVLESAPRQKKTNRTGGNFAAASKNKQEPQKIFLRIIFAVILLNILSRLLYML